MFYLIFLSLIFVYTGALAGSKDESFGSSSGDRLVYLTTCFVGQHVDVQVKNGSMYSGIFHSTNAEKDFGMFSTNAFDEQLCNHFFIIICNFMVWCLQQCLFEPYFQELY